jgi:hypothetical protein
MQRSSLRAFSTLLAMLFSATQASATSVLQMNLAELTERSDVIVRGSIIEIRELRVAVGGGDLPALRYRVEVDEAFKGAVRTEKGVAIAEFTTIGDFGRFAAGKPLIASWPELRVGQQYLLFIAPPGPTGLTATMGIGQGCFAISGSAVASGATSLGSSPSSSSAASSPSAAAGSSASAAPVPEETAVNGVGNVGLFRGMSAAGLPSSGPVAYGALAARIRTELGR